MSVMWANMRIPKGLHERLTARAADMLAAHQDGRSALPSQHVEHVPLYHVIERALDELDGHRARARAQGKRKTNVATAAPCAVGVYTSPTQEPSL